MVGVLLQWDTLSGRRGSVLCPWPPWKKVVKVFRMDESEWVRVQSTGLLCLGVTPAQVGSRKVSQTLESWVEQLAL